MRAREKDLTPNIYLTIYRFAEISIRVEILVVDKKDCNRKLKMISVSDGIEWRTIQQCWQLNIAINHTVVTETMYIFSVLSFKKIY